MYAAIYTRSDIVFTIGHFNQYFSDSKIHYEQALMILLRYIRFTIDLDIVYKTKLSISESSNSNKNFKFKTFSNFDDAVDKLNKKSILEYIYMFVEELTT